MAINIKDTLDRGGVSMVQLLAYCVYTQKLDPMFQLLVMNYQLQPSGPKALAVYESFIAAQAPLPLSASKVEKSSDWQVTHTIEKIRKADRLLGQPISEESDDSPVYVKYLPTKNLFDAIFRVVMSNSTQFPLIESEFDPALTAVENLPGGQLTSAQRNFNEHVWKPSRQRLTAAGFFTIANIGG